MIALILIKKIFSLFLIIFAGVVLVKTGVVKAEESKSLSTITLYLLMPCMILSAFQVDYTEEVRDGLILAFKAAVLIHAGLLLFSAVLKKIFRLDAVELDSVVYSNAGNLIIPLVTAILGTDWVIYTSAFISVQQILLWSHGKMILCGEKSVDLKKIVTNINMIAILAGIVLFLTRLRFPAPVQDALDMVGSMMAPVSMIVTGMLIGSADLKKILTNHRIWLIAALRLAAIPLVMVLAVKSVLPVLTGNSPMILLISLLATMTPPASCIIQMAQVYGRDADYASAINVVSTLFCIFTMPVLAFLYQM